MMKAGNEGVIQTDAELLRWSVSIGEEVRLSLEGEVDLSNQPELSEVLAAIVAANPERVVVDLAGLSFLDSTGIQCLLDAMQKAAAVGCKLVMQHPTPLILRTLEICGVDALLLNHANEFVVEAR